MYREKERARISAKYGVYHDPWWSDGPSTTTIFDPFNSRREVGTGDDYDLHPSGRFRHPNLPDVEVYDVTTGQRIYTVLDDPDGTQGLILPDNSADQIDLLKKSMASLQAQLQAVTMELGRRAPEDAADIAGDQVEDDVAVLPQTAPDPDPAPEPVANLTTTVTPPKGSSKKKSTPAPATTEDGIE
jgi:hypothetical protein